MEWVPTTWQTAEGLADVRRRPSMLVEISLMVSPFYEGERYAVRRGSAVLAKDGAWEFEPTPSSRDDAFYERCRFKSFDDAKRAAEAAIVAMAR